VKFKTPRAGIAIAARGDDQRRTRKLNRRVRRFFCPIADRPKSKAKCFERKCQISFGGLWKKL